MKRASVSLVLCLVACTVQKGNGINPNDAIVDVSWSVRTVAGQEVPCPTGITQAEVIAQPVDPTTGSPQGAPLTTLFDCAAKTGTISVIPDSYILSVRLLASDGTTVYADSLPTGQLDLQVSDTSQQFDIFTDGGYLQLGWDLVDHTGASLTCELASVTDVRVVLTPASGSGARVTTGPLVCDQFSGTTSVIPAGTYTLTIEAEASGTVAGSATLPATPIGATNQLSGVGTITIPILGK